METNKWQMRTGSDLGPVKAANKVKIARKKCSYST